MSLLEGTRIALGQIWAHKLKSFFSLLGVVVGITFLIAVITVVEGMNRYVREDFGGSIFGVNTFTVVRRPQVQIGPSSSKERRRLARNPYLSLHDVEVVSGAVPDAASLAYATDRGFDEVQHRERRRKNIRVVGGSPAYQAVMGWDVEQGRALSPLDERQGLKVAVLGASISEKLFPDGRPLGRRIRIRAHRFRVVGVLERQGGLAGNLRDASVLVPFSTYRQTLASHPDRIEEIHVRMGTAESMERAKLDVEAALRADRGLRPRMDNDFHLQTSSEVLDAWNQINTVLVTALPGLVSIALVVGGIVIMNIMLVSVTQRIREIGIRKATGARQRDILLQFLGEAALLSLIGAGLGILLGIGLAGLVEAFTPLPAVTPTWAYVLSVTLGILVGLASGIYPARRAAGMDPVVALGHE